MGTVRIPAPRRSDGRNVGQFLPGNRSRRARATKQKTDIVDPLRALALTGYPIDQFRTIADIKVFPFR